MKAELKIGSVNQILKGTQIYQETDLLDSIAMVVKGRIRIHGYGINILAGSGNFLGLRDLSRGVHSVTYTAQTNAVIYTFGTSGSLGDIRRIFQAKGEYGALMVAGLSRSLGEEQKAFDKFQRGAQEAYETLDGIYRRGLQIAADTGAVFDTIPAMDKTYPFDEPQILPFDKIRYYQASTKVPADIQKAFYSASEEICLYHVREQIELLHEIHGCCITLTEYMEGLLKLCIGSRHNLYHSVTGFTATLQRAGQDSGEAMEMLDKTIELINQIETLLQDCGGVQVEIDRHAMEEMYFALLSPGKDSVTALAQGEDSLALVENMTPDASGLKDTLEGILEFGQIQSQEAAEFVQLVKQFEEMEDKESTSDDARNLRRSLSKAFYPIYEKVFLQDYWAKEEETPLEVDLFLRYGFLSERLLREDLINELIALDTRGGQQGESHVFDMKEWLGMIMSGERNPSKNEFDMDYEEHLRDKKKNGEITEQQERTLNNDNIKKLEFEVHNMFRSTHRLVNGQVTIFVPFLHTGNCMISPEKSFLSKDKVSAAINRLRRIDFSAFYREALYSGDAKGMAKEFVQVEVCPDVIVMPTMGTKDIMWQELGGRKRTTPGRFLLPIFLEGDLDKCITHLTGSFRWELCRTMQGAYWNNIQYKSLTSEYSDFLQFYRKNKELSDDRKEKLKVQIQKHRNNSREIFASDYMNWIQHEAQGGMLLSKPVRTIMATYCPFSSEIRQGLAEQPMFKNAMAVFQRERAKKCREYELKFRVWEKDQVEIPEEIVATRDFYQG